MGSSARRYNVNAGFTLREGRKSNTGDSWDKDNSRSGEMKWNDW